MSARAVVFALLGLSVVALAVNLARIAPSPGELTAVHAALPELAGLAGCEQCHAEGDLVDGCGGCHREIAAQLASGSGWHGALVAQGRTDCGDCHGEHWGADFPLVHEQSWGDGPAVDRAHRHVAFALDGAHARLDCADCHVAKLPEGTAERLAIAASRRTFLGLAQDCASCHADPHGAAMSDDCAACHDQERFAPAPRFEHAARFPLIGAHARVGCVECHPGASDLASDLASGAAPAVATAARPLDFATVRGTTCEQCHATPHRALPADRCTTCHFATDVTFATATQRVAADDHARFGFALTAPHAERTCAQCHDPARPFAQRYPGRAANDCTACHESPHGGQFGARESNCAECHSTHFVPSTLTAAAHQPTLLGRHLDAACAKCHAAPSPGAPVRFVATPTACAQCHADPHGGQFVARGQSCESCHDATCFVPSRYDVATRHPPRIGAHAAAECAGCHRSPKAGAPIRYVATPTACEACHADPHGGQFRRQKGGCAACHDEKRFVPSTFAANRHQPPLTGAHRAIACNDCHRTRGDGVRTFVGTARDCKSCHADPHAGQLTRAGNDCNRCHRSDERWLPVTFDHQRDARFALDGVHARLDCVQCHREVELPDGRKVVHYVPLGVECRDCHTGR
ncbi:MAG: hypothetical protein JNL90_00275 [Planctomycetes bacterium]|nr:hypothetical protein [Planctomycetota bacterium]